MGIEVTDHLFNFVLEGIRLAFYGELHGSSNGVHLRIHSSIGFWRIMCFSTMHITLLSGTSGNQSPSD